MRNLVANAWPFLCLLTAPIMAGCGPAPAQPNGPAQGKPPEVSVSAVINKTVSDYEDFPGRLEAVNAIDIRSRVTGFLTKVNFKEGSIVSKGEVLFEIDERPYKAELDRTEGVVLQMDGRLKRLETELARSKTLLASNAASQEEHDKLVGDRTEADGNLRVAKANRETAKLRLGWTKVESPLTGRISRRFIDPGNLVKEDETILTQIVDLDPIYAYFDVDERTTLRFQKLIREGWSKDAKLPVYLGLADEEKTEGDQNGFPRRGAIHFADNKIDWETGTWRLRGLFDNKDMSLAHGSFVRIRLPIGAPHHAELISEQALGADQGQKFVYVIDDKNRVSYRRVQIGRLRNGLREITDGLKVGDKVIVSGLQRPRPGIEVTPLMQSEAVILKLDKHASSVTVRMKDERAQDAEKTFELTKDVRMFDLADRTVDSDSFQPGTLVLITAHEGRLRELHQRKNEDQNSQGAAAKEPKR